MAYSERFSQRILDIGREIFEFADTAQPNCLHKAWWLEQATHAVEQDERLKTRAFTFVDCLPALRSHAEITRHVSEYLDPGNVDLPPVFHALVGEGRLQKLRESVVGWCARFGATQMAGRFITGYDAPSAIRTIERLRDSGMAFTIDVLGESTTSYAQADRYAQVYHKLIDDLTAVSRHWPKIPIIDEDSRGPFRPLICASN